MLVEEANRLLFSIFLLDGLLLDLIFWNSVERNCLCGFLQLGDQGISGVDVGLEDLLNLMLELSLHFIDLGRMDASHVHEVLKGYMGVLFLWSKRH